MERKTDLLVDNDKILSLLHTWFDDTSRDFDSSRLFFTIFGPPGVGKSYICSKFESEVCKRHKNVRVIWVENRTIEDFVAFLEQFNCHSCNINKCKLLPEEHHQELLVGFLQSCDDKHVFIFQVASVFSTKFFDRVIERIANPLYKANGKVIRLDSCSKRDPDRVEERVHLQQLPASHSRSLIQSINGSIPEESVDALCKATYYNPFLLKLSVSFVTFMSPIYGNNIARFLSELESFANYTDLDLNRHVHKYEAYLLISFMWNFFNHMHRLGKFAQAILRSSVYMKTWLPVSLLEKLKFPHSTYTESKIESETPVSAITFNLLRNLGFFHYNDNEDKVRIPNIVKEFIVERILNTMGLERNSEFLLLNMRYTEEFVEFVIRPYEIIKEVLSNPHRGEFLEHAMAILRKPLSRLLLSRSKGISVKMMLLELIRLLTENESYDNEVSIEMWWFIKENQFYSFTLENESKALNDIWSFVKKELGPRSKTFLRITQTICFLLCIEHVEEAQVYFNYILESGFLGVVDEECLEAQKYYRNHVEQRRPLQDKDAVVTPDKDYTTIYITQPENYRTIIQNNLSELSSKTVLSVELCCELVQRGLVSESEHEKLFYYTRCGQHAEGATFLYNIITSRASDSNISSFLDLLLLAKCSNVVDTIHGYLSEFNTNDKEIKSRIPLPLFNKEEAGFLERFESGTYNTEGKFEGIHFAEEQTANKLLIGISGPCVRKMLDGMEFSYTGSKEEFIDQVRKTTKCLHDGSLWWNPKTLQLPPNFIERSVQNLPLTGDKGVPIHLSDLIRTDNRILWLLNSPGMGKKTITTKLEAEWRSSLPLWRVIVRIDLNNVKYSPLTENSDTPDDLKSFLHRFVPYLPLESLYRLAGGQVRLVVLLDEVHSASKDILLRVLQLLYKSQQKSSNWRLMSNFFLWPQLEEPLRLDKVFIVSQSRLFRKLPKEFQAKAFSLVPLPLGEQIQFLHKEVSWPSFSEESAEELLLSLPTSSKLLMVNPLMLSLFAQIIKSGNRETKRSHFRNICDLYQRFIESKSQVTRLKPFSGCDLFEMSLPDYYAPALSQLGATWIVEQFPSSLLVPPHVQILREKHQNKMVVVSSSTETPFELPHESFADFFYARLLSKPTTPPFLKEILFTQMYSDGNFCRFNVEQFLLCALNEGRLQGKNLQPLSKHEKSMGIIPTQGKEIVSLEDPELLHAIFQGTTHLHTFLSRMVLENYEWAHRNNFNLPASSLANIWDKQSPIAITELLCSNPLHLTRLFTEEQVSLALSSCDSVVEIVCKHSKYFQQGKQSVESRISRQELRRALKSRRSLEATLIWPEAAWWVAEHLTKAELHSLLTNEHTRVSDVIGSNPRQVEIVWGEEFLGNFVDFRYRFSGRFADGKWSVFNGKGMSYAVEKICGHVNVQEEIIIHVREALLRCQNWRLLEELEKQEEKKISCSLGEIGVKRTISLIERVIGKEENCLWDRMAQIPVELFPYVIRYGKLENVKKLFRQVPVNNLHEEYCLSIFLSSLIISMLVDKTDETFNHVVSAIKDIEDQRREGLYYVIMCLHCVQVDDFRKEVSSCSFSCEKQKLPLVCQVSWGEIVLRFQKYFFKTAVDPTDNIVKLAVRDLMKKLPTNAVSGMTEFTFNEELSHFLRYLFLEEAAKSSISTSVCNADSKTWLPKFLWLMHKLGYPERRGIPDIFKTPDLMTIIVQSRISCETYPEEWNELNTAIETMESKVRSYFYFENKSHLFKIARELLSKWQFRTEEEWTVVLQTFLLIPKIDVSSQVCQVYADPTTALLRVLCRYFGVKETCKITEKLLSSSTETLMSGIDAVLLAVELGSLSLLKKVAWPCLLSWRDEDGLAILDISLAKWGSSHNVTRFLQHKFQLTFCF